MYGSDLPSTLIGQSYQKLVDYGIDLFTEEEIEKVYYETANQVYFGS